MCNQFGNLFFNDVRIGPAAGSGNNLANKKSGERFAAFRVPANAGGFGEYRRFRLMNHLYRFGYHGGIV